MLQDGGAPNPLNGLFKIDPNKRRECGAVRRPVERKAPGCVRDCLKVRRGQVAEPVGEAGNTSIWTESHAIQVLAEQALATRSARQADFDLLRKPPASQNPWVDVVSMVCGANQKNILFGLQVADLNHELLSDLDIVLAHRPGRSRQQTIHLVNEDE